MISQNVFPKSKTIVVIENLKSVHAFNRFKEDAHVEKCKRNFGLIDLTRDYLYDIDVPTMTEEISPLKFYFES